MKWGSVRVGPHFIVLIVTDGFEETHKIVRNSIISVNYATSKNISGVYQLLRSQNIDAPHLIDEIGGSLRVPADSTTIWLEDFESDISDWRIENGWELTQNQATAQLIVSTWMIITMALVQASSLPLLVYPLLMKIMKY